MHSYGRVTEFSWLLKADTEAAEIFYVIRKRVPLGDGSRNEGFVELGCGTANFAFIFR